jgi:hypothetical protein
MEQTNLVVTPDGKTWDEVTRDVSYIGNTVLHTSTDTVAGSAVYHIFDEWRGVRGASTETRNDLFNKDSWAIAYDRMICLVAGHYSISFHGISQATVTNAGQIVINGVTHSGSATVGSGNTTFHNEWTGYLNRGDYVQGQGTLYSWGSYNHFFIRKLSKETR